MNRPATRNGEPAFVSARPRLRAAVPMREWLAMHENKPRAPFWRRLIGRITWGMCDGGS